MGFTSVPSSSNFFAAPKTSKHKLPKGTLPKKACALSTISVKNSDLSLYSKDRCLMILGTSLRVVKSLSSRGLSRYFGVVGVSLRLRIRVVGKRVDYSDFNWLTSSETSSVHSMTSRTFRSLFKTYRHSKYVSPMTE